MPAPTIVIDTQIVSYLLLRDANPLKERSALHIEGHVAALSFQTIAELKFGALRKRWGESRMRELDATIKRFVALAGDAATADAWAVLKMAAEAKGRSKSAEDLWIAATAKRHALPLLTNDGDFFSALEIEVRHLDSEPTG